MMWMVLFAVLLVAAVIGGAEYRRWDKRTRATITMGSIWGFPDHGWMTIGSGANAEKVKILSIRSSTEIEVRRVRRWHVKD